VKPRVSDEILNKISSYFNYLIVNYRKSPMRGSRLIRYKVLPVTYNDKHPKLRYKVLSETYNAVAKWIS